MRELILWLRECDVIACYLHFRRDLRWSRTKSVARAFWCAWC